MNQLDDAKKRYDETPIPEELSGRIQGAIEQFEGRKATSTTNHNGNGKRRYYKWGLGTAAAFLITFTAALNINTAFAEEVHQIPVVGAIARVLTVSSYKKTVGDEKKFQ